MKDTANYHRGDIVLADLPPGIGSVQRGIRPVLILQNNIGNRYAPTIVVSPLTTQLKKPAMPTHCILKGVPGLKATSMVLLEQILTIDKRQIIRYLGKLDRTQRREMETALHYSIGQDGGSRRGENRKPNGEQEKDDILASGRAALYTG